MRIALLYTITAYKQHIYIYIYIYTTFDTTDQGILLWYNLHISPYLLTSGGGITSQFC